jgi:two-component system repressor protein LuxO
MGAAPRPSSALRLLLVDADPNARRALRTALEARITRPLLIMETAEPETARAMLAERGFDAAAVDLDTVGGPAAFAALGERAPGAVFYALGPAANVQDAVAAVRSGAADFIEKPIDGPAFARRIERQFVGDEANRAGGGDTLAGTSAPMRALFEQIARVAPAQAPVFVFGETGTGKTAVAQAVHARSKRRGGPFVTVECTGRTGEDIVAELTGSGGAFDRADGGTLFLDEVGRLPEAAQAVLLRALDSGEIGGPTDRRKVAVRIVASSNRRQGEIAGRGGLRPDLYFRLAVLTLTVPALRERPDDLGALADDCARRAAREAGCRPVRLTADAQDLLARQDWPGNLSELRNLMEAVTRAHGGATVDAGEIAAFLRAPGPARATARAIRPLWMEEARLIEEAIEAFDGNIARAAAALEISPSTIYRKRRGNPEDGAEAERRWA